MIEVSLKQYNKHGELSQFQVQQANQPFHFKNKNS
jgi:hypothetical protein